MIQNSVLRLQEGALQTPIHEFRHPETQSRLGLIGMIHIGSPQYYDSVLGYIGRAEECGAEVHYELIKRMTDEQAAEHPKVAAWAEYLRNDPLSTIIPRYLGVVHQKDAIKPPDRWHNHDIDFLELADRLGDDFFEKMIRDHSKLRESLEELPRDVANTVLRTVIKLMPVIEPAIRVFGSRTKMQTLIVKERNELALHALRTRRQEAPEQDFVLMWGSGHGPGIMKGIRAEGYNQVNTLWLPAISLRQPTES